MSNSRGTLPISEIIKKGKDLEKSDDDRQVKRSRQEAYKKEKELEEARKAGNAPALVDEDGKDINPHIPQYISSVPFFYNTNHPTLKHQRSLKPGQKHVPINLNLQRGVKIQNATKYRPGACENCGAMTHKKKDCLERPRKLGAKYTNKNIAPDEVILPEIEHSFDSKRDRWSGYHPEMYKQTIEEFNKVEETKRRLKEESLRKEADAVSKAAHDDDESDDDDDSDAGTKNTGGDTANKPQASRETGDVDLNDSLSDDSDDDDEKYADKADMPGTKVDSKQRITVRNLRLREDTAKYLYNLDIDSAYYDPKTRSMRDNPVPAASSSSGKAAAIAQFTGENFVRYTGDVNKINNAQVFAWQAAEKGVDIHLQALPTKTEIIQKEFEINKKEYSERISKYIKHKYGEPEQQARPVSELQLDQSERYVEYTRTGRVLKGPGVAPPTDQKGIN
uniref:Pre-mRNA-splicing factor SLU7 n=1 Tax=Aceria tosichella TaxID=561515 RepID=A0A6G1S6G2_9ACAR